MDYDPQWAAAGLFSPSKARQEQALAKDWSYVDDWLRTKYGPKTVPIFERNEETLQVLLDLAAHNERADEQQSLVDAVEKAALEDLTRQSPTGRNAEVYDALEASIGDLSREALSTLADAVVTLNCTTPSPEDMAYRIIETTNARFDLSQQLRRTEEMSKYLSAERSRLEELLVHVESEAFLAPPDLPQQIVFWTKGTKHLKEKLIEYNDRLSASKASAAKPSVQDIAAQQAESNDMQTQIFRLEDALAAYDALPMDPGTAREMLNESEAELRELVARRDRLFERLVQR